MSLNEELHLRMATPEDLELLEFWDGQEHVRASGYDEENWEEELSYRPAWREQLIAELNGRPIGFIQIIDAAKEESHYWGKVDDNVMAIDIWIGKEEDLGLGYGTVMMKKSFDRCFRRPDVKGILIDPLVSNTKAHKFYENLGFEFQEERKFEDDLCRVYYFPRSKWNPLL